MARFQRRPDARHRWAFAAVGQVLVALAVLGGPATSAGAQCFTVNAVGGSIPPESSDDPCSIYFDDTTPDVVETTTTAPRPIVTTTSTTKPPPPPSTTTTPPTTVTTLPPANSVEQSSTSDVTTRPRATTTITSPRRPTTPREAAPTPVRDPEPTAGEVTTTTTTTTTPPPPPTPGMSPLVVRGIGVGQPAAVPGGPAQATGADCPARSPVALRLGGRDVGRATADGHGQFDADLTLPPDVAVGRQLVSALCGPVTLEGPLDLVLISSVHSAASGTTTLAALLCLFVLIVLVLRSAPSDRRRRT